MDLLTVGLGRRSSEQSLLREISRNSAIAWRLDTEIKSLNSATSAFLRSPQTLHAISLATSDETTTPQHSVIQDAFQSVCRLVHVDNYRKNTAFSVDLLQLAHTYAKVETVDTEYVCGAGSENRIDSEISLPTCLGQSPAPSVSPLLPTHNEISTQDRVNVEKETLRLIDHYVLLIASLHLSNNLILSSLRIKANLVYWESLQASTRARLLYFVQTGPSRIMGGVSLLITYVLGKLSQHNTTSGQDGARTTDAWRDLVYTAQIAWNFTIALIKKCRQDCFPAGAAAAAMMTSNAPWHHRYQHHIRLIAQSPLRIVNNEIARKIAAANATLASNSASIDALLRVDYGSIPQLLAVLAQTTGVDTRVSRRGQIAAILGCAADASALATEVVTPPSFLCRYWPLFYVLARYGPSQTISAYSNRDEIFQWVKHNLLDTCSGFVSNWLIKPFRDMLGILRSDSDLTLTSKESLESDLNSLERMVADYVSDKHITGITREQIHTQVRSGDLTSLMSQYEEDIRSPIKALAKGSLVRAILIQVQKTKVDGGVALNGIDKLLKSQQLVFGVVSVSPSLFIVYSLWTYLARGKPLIVNGKQLNIVCIKALNDIESHLVLTKQEQALPEHPPNAHEGKIMVEVVNLIIILKPLIPLQLKRDWVRDLNDLTNTNYAAETRLDFMRKIWNVYGPFFRASA